MSIERRQYMILENSPPGQTQSDMGFYIEILVPRFRNEVLFISVQEAGDVICLGII